uniref:Gamma-glutamylcyclotransferase n=1 Tax=Romanomermis culicivorax TaxID=13658 RepID=A0A915JQ08_ROMCU
MFVSAVTILLSKQWYMCKITSSMGPSGKNLDYFWNLLKFLRKHDAEESDPYLINLEAIIISICKEKCIEYLQLE